MSNSQHNINLLSPKDWDGDIIPRNNNNVPLIINTMLWMKKEASNLIENGFEYVATIPNENIMLFRKRK